MKNAFKILLLFINIILYFVVIALWIAIPEELTLNIASTLAALSLTIVLLYLYRDNLKSYYQSHHFKKLTESVVFFSLLFSLLAVINYWSYKHPVQVDFSSIKINSLSDQTKNVLSKLDGELTFKLFARKSESLAWMTLIDFYRIEKSSLKIEKIDIDVRPDLVSDYQISNAATLVVEYNGKRQKVVERDELNITNALIKVSRTSDPVVYFIQGHNEGDLNSPENEGLKFIFEAARNSAVDLRPLSLLSSQEIPFDAKAVILWGPKTSLQKSEIQLLKSYLNRGGNLMVALDPDFNRDQQPELRALLQSFKIILKNDLVIDKESFVNGSDGSIPLVSSYSEDHVITRRFKGQVFFPLTSSLEPIPDEILPDVRGNVHSLISSSAFPRAWSETNFDEVIKQDISFTQGADQPGPRALMMTYEDDKNRLVAFGNSTFVINAYSKYANNYALFLNSLSWLVGEDRLISFNLPIIQSEPVFISAPQMGIIFYFSVLFCPLILFGVAIFLYRRKRDK